MIGAVPRSSKRRSGTSPISTALSEADYTNDGLRRVLNDTFGSRTLGDSSATCVVATFDPRQRFRHRDGVRSWKPKFFHNFEEPGSTDRDQLVVDVADAFLLGAHLLPHLPGVRWTVASWPTYPEHVRAWAA